MKISIIIPVYNVSNYIKRCIYSIINQTYNDIECICIDDGTPDDSIEKIEAILSSYTGPIEFRIVHHKVNRGLSAARNTGVDEAKGDYLLFVDSDDELTVSSLEYFQNCLSNGEKPDIIIGSTISKPPKAFYSIDNFRTTTIIKGNDEIRKNIYCSKNAIPVCAWNKLIRREFFIDNELYFKEGLLYEDHHWMYFVAKKAVHIRFCFEATYIHYITPNSIMTTSNREKFTKHFSVILKDVFSTIDEPFAKAQIWKYLSQYIVLCGINGNSNNLEVFHIGKREMLKRKMYISYALLCLLLNSSVLRKLGFQRVCVRYFYKMNQSKLK